MARFGDIVAYPFLGGLHHRFSSRSSPSDARRDRREISERPEKIFGEMRFCSNLMPLALLRIFDHRRGLPPSTSVDHAIDRVKLALTAGTNQRAGLACTDPFCGEAGSGNHEIRV